MSEIERLDNWMRERGYSKRTMAEAVGMSYDGFYQIFWRKKISPGFKLRFINRFGAEAADRVFDKPALSQPEPV